MHARRPEHRGDFHPVPAGEVDKGLGGHARNDFQPNTCGIRRMLCDGARLAEIVPPGAGRHIHLHPLQRLNAQLGVVVDPLLGTVRSPHGLAVVSASVLLGGADSIGHAGAGGVQIPGEGAHKLEQVRVALGQVHGGSTTHGQAEDGPVAVGPIAVLQHGDKLIEQEGLPHVVLAVVFGKPVGVEGGFATNGQDHIDVLIREHLFNVGFAGPAAFNVGGPQPVEGPHLGEFPIRLGMPIAGQQHLHLDHVFRHDLGLNLQFDAPIGDPLDALHRHPIGQAINLGPLVHANRGAFHRIGVKVIGQTIQGAPQASRA